MKVKGNGRLHLGAQAEAIGLQYFFTFQTMTDIMIHLHRENYLYIAAQFRGNTELEIPCKAHPFNVLEMGVGDTTLYAQDKGIRIGYSFYFIAGDHLNPRKSGAWGGSYFIQGTMINVQTLIIWQNVMRAFYCHQNQPVTA